MLKLLSVLIICLLSVNSRAQNKVSGPAGEQEHNIQWQVRQVESQLSAIVENNDVNALDKILYPMFTVQSSKGTLTRKTQLLNGFRNGNNPYSKFRPQADSVVIVNASTVITSGKETYAHKGATDAGDQARFFYHVWIKENDSWLLAGRVIATIPEK